MKLDSFSEKLGLALKALVLSRTGLASGMNVDKSLVGRWVAGSVSPSEHNLAKLTRFIAERVDGFTMLDWDKDIVEFSQVLGISTAATSPASGTPGFDLVPPEIFEEGLRGASLRASAYEGFWQTTRPSNDIPGHYIRDITMIRRRQDGLVGFTTGVANERFHGWALLLGHQFFSIGWDATYGTMMFGIFNGVARLRAEVLDGLSVATLHDAGSSPVASACVMHRVGDLSGDVAADNEYFNDEVETLIPIVPPSAVPEKIRAHLASAVVPDSPGMMTMVFAQSMARGPMFEAG